MGAFFNRTFSALGACLANASGSQMQIAMGTTIFIDLLRTRFGWEWRSCSKQRWRQIVPVSSKKPKQKRCHFYPPFWLMPEILDADSQGATGL